MVRNVEQRPVLFALVRELLQSEKLQEFAESLPARARVSEPALPLVVSALHEHLGRALTILVPEDADARDLAEAAAWYLGPERVALLPSRGVRWDSDHVVTLTDELNAIAQELVRGNYLARTHIGLDFFDASINRIAAWTIGTRNMIRALCIAMLEPYTTYKKLERDGDYTSRLALMEEAKTLPFGAVWDYYCLKQGVPVGADWLDEVKNYEKSVLSKRA